jgi:hypothetical protein
MAMSPERKAERKAARDFDKRMNKLVSIAHQVKVTGNLVSAQIAGTIIQGEVENFNNVVEKLGYRPIRLTSNMLNPDSPTFAIDINTPAYCDPGCESYHTM